MHIDLSWSIEKIGQGTLKGKLADDKLKVVTPYFSQKVTDAPVVSIPEVEDTPTLSSEYVVQVKNETVTPIFTTTKQPCWRQEQNIELSLKV